VNLYSIESFEDYFYGFMANHTGYIKTFDLFLYEGGFVLQLPAQKEPGQIPEFKLRRRSFMYRENLRNGGINLILQQLETSMRRLPEVAFRIFC